MPISNLTKSTLALADNLKLAIARLEQVVAAQSSLGSTSSRQSIFSAQDQKMLEFLRAAQENPEGFTGSGGVSEASVLQTIQQYIEAKELGDGLAMGRLEDYFNQIGGRLRLDVFSIREAVALFTRVAEGMAQEAAGEGGGFSTGGGGSSSGRSSGAPASASPATSQFSRGSATASFGANFAKISGAAKQGQAVQQANAEAAVAAEIAALGDQIRNLSAGMLHGTQQERYYKELQRAQRRLEELTKQVPAAVEKAVEHGTAKANGGQVHNMPTRVNVLTGKF